MLRSALLVTVLSACRPDAAPDQPDGGLPAEFALAVDPAMPLMVHATWDTPAEATDAWVEHRHSDEDWVGAPAVGPGQATLLGFPPLTAVEARLVLVVDGTTTVGPSAVAITGALPIEVLVPEVLVWDPALADPAPYAMITVASADSTFDGPFVVSIFDRAGNIVWYRVLPRDVMSFFGSPSRDGTHVWFEQEHIFVPGDTPDGVTRTTLDGRWSSFWPVPDLGQAISEGADGAFLLERRAPTEGVFALDRLGADGDPTRVWDCGAYFEDVLGIAPDGCPMNTCNVDLARNTSLVSQFRTGSVFEIDLATGLPIRQAGQLEVGEPYAFDDPASGFAYQHDPRWTDAGTLLVTTHLPCGGTDAAPEPEGCDPVRGQPGVQLTHEYAVDDARRTLTPVWTYRSEDRWATQWGEAIPARDGNVVQGYGQDGAVREVTRDGAVAWEVEWPRGDGGYRLIGHLSLIDDLYALNRGPDPR